MSKSSATSTIYGLSSSFKPDLIRYVGATTRGLSRRLKEHIAQAHNKQRTQWIKATLDCGDKVIIRELETVELRRARYVESWWVGILQQTGNLVNMKGKKSRTSPKDKSRSSKLTEENVISIKKMFRDGSSVQEMAKAFSVSKNTINSILSRVIWKSVN